MSAQAITYLEFKDSGANSVDLVEVAHYEPPHQDLRCLQIHLFSSLVLKELRIVYETVAYRALLNIKYLKLYRILSTFIL